MTKVTLFNSTTGLFSEKAYNKEIKKEKEIQKQLHKELKQEQKEEERKRRILEKINSKKNETISSSIRTSCPSSKLQQGQAGNSVNRRVAQHPRQRGGIRIYDNWSIASENRCLWISPRIRARQQAVA